VRGACRGSLRKLDVGTALRSSEPALRGWAAEVVAGRGSDASVYGEVMAKLLSDESKDVRYWAASALSGMGAAAAEFAAEVEKAVKDPNPDVWPHILRIISLHVTQALDGACTAMVSHFADDDAHRRRCAIRALGSARDSALPFMGEVAKCLEDADVGVRLAAIEALHCGGKRAVRKGDKTLAAMARGDPDSQVRREALHILRHYMIAGKFGLDGVF